MRPEDIMDQVTLKKWLVSQPHGVTRIIALRAAMRVLPRMGAAAENSPELLLLVIRLHFHLLNVATAGPATLSNLNVQGPNLYQRTLENVATPAILHALAAARTSSKRVAAKNAAQCVLRSVKESGQAESLIYGAIQNDASIIGHQAGLRETLCRPLWPNGNDHIAADWQYFCAVLRSNVENNPGRRFWMEWYEATLEGRPLLGSWGRHWALIADIADIEQEIWDGGFGAVDKRVEATLLKYAIKATPNAEVVTLNQETNRFRVDPVSNMPADHLHEAVEKLTNAVKVFDVPSGHNDRHFSVRTEADIVRDSTRRYGTRPRMLHSTCLRVIRRLDAKIRNGDCPAPDQDADIADFYATIIEVAKSLAERDPFVQEAINASASCKLPTLQPNERETLIKSADEIAELSEGNLAEELPEDVRAALDDATPSAERNVSWYAVVSRLLRVWALHAYRGSKMVLEETEDVTKSVAGIAKNAAIIAGSGGAITTPLWLEWAIQIIMKYMF